ncbi:hypothetical protein NEFER03_2170 [Nematocida sp. LUAm3]|nr:hypothetical protein NEFER03_2170 [Nematocida sp. LUAm3]KAI5176278.1 hypothetical protein NEFER02_2070 [Nematocida sp. LUAm2]KAI5179222.1 hypothetical protein NEFER01_2076 [Nematocida sp. LUAm1]
MSVPYPYRTVKVTTKSKEIIGVLRGKDAYMNVTLQVGKDLLIIRGDKIQDIQYQIEPSQQKY